MAEVAEAAGGGATAVDQAEGSPGESGWDTQRWARVLDRIEHRDPEAGLRFWGPPLSLEVTMEGPDSDRWADGPAGVGSAISYNWHSDEPCPDVTGPEAAAWDDDRLLASASRYTIENLWLNAVHEIGEWLRLDGERLYPAHGRGARRHDPRLRPDGAQGNGAVRLILDDTSGGTDTAAPGDLPPATSSAVGDSAREGPGLERLASRFDYPPGVTVSLGPSGPLLAEARVGAAVTTSRSAWSAEALAAVAGGSVDPAPVVGRDIHHLMVCHQARGICGRFHVDGRPAWRLRGDPGEGRALGLAVAYDGWSTPIR